jgi:hypothetical protein
MTDKEDKKKKAVKVPINPKLWEQFTQVAAADTGTQLHTEKEIGIRKLDTLLQEYVTGRLEVMKFAKKKLHKLDTGKA